MGYSIRAPKAIKLTAEQAAERRAATETTAREATADDRARQLAALADQPVPAHATWVYDSNTGKKTGYLTAAGVVPLPAAPAPAEPVVIIACGARKLKHTAPAAELYTSTYFAGNLAAARALGGRVLILSALHGLVELDQLVEPYNLRMGQPGSVTATRVAEQAAELGIAAAAVTVLAGKTYAAVVSTVWPDAARPYDGSRGIGDHKARAKTIAATGRRSSAAPRVRPARPPRSAPPACRPASRRRRA